MTSSQKNPLAHRWFAQHRDGAWWVNHTTGSGCTIDGIGVPSDILGPFGNEKVARAVAGELTAVFVLGCANSSSW
jgi:hypothetical protein